MSDYRFMRTVLFFDLPMVTKTDIREYTRFLKFIKRKGFVAFQESVYTKLSLNESVANAALKEIKQQLPRDGLISVLTLSEKQFASIEHLLGEPKTDVLINDEKVVTL